MAIRRGLSSDFLFLKQMRKYQIWYPEEEKLLKRIGSTASWDILLKSFPSHPYRSIKDKLQSFNIKRTQFFKKMGEEEVKKIETKDAITKMIEIAEKTKVLPPLKIYPVLPKVPKGDEEELVVLLSDAHVGHKTKTYNSEVFKRRLQQYYNAIKIIVDIHRSAFPIRICNVFLLGDLVHNDLLGRFCTLEEIESPVIDQFTNIVVPEISNFLMSLTKIFEKVKVYGVRGNHGAVWKFAAESTNWDYVVYKFIETRLANQKRITFNFPKDFFQLVRIQRHTFLLVHGDQIPMHLTLPWYGTTTKAMRWQGSMPERFEYVCLGHFHFPSIVTWNEIEILTNGCFVSDDEWVRKRLGLKSEPKQIIFGVHPRIGISFRYYIDLEHQKVT